MARIGTMGDHEVVVVRVVVRWSSGDEVLRVGLDEKDGKVGCECGVLMRLSVVGRLIEKLSLFFFLIFFCV